MPDRLAAWAPHVISLIASVAIGGYTWARINDRVEQLESRVAAENATAAHTVQLLDNIDRRLVILTCRLYPNECR